MASSCPFFNGFAPVCPQDDSVTYNSVPSRAVPVPCRRTVRIRDDPATLLLASSKNLKISSAQVSERDDGRQRKRAASEQKRARVPWVQARSGPGPGPSGRSPPMPFLSTPSFDLSAGAEPTLGPRPAAPPPPPTAAAHHHQQQAPVSEAAARRLREAEERLREAIEELHRHQGGGGGKVEGDGQLEGERGCDHDGESCAAHAAGNLCQSFLLSYGVRVGIGILLRAFKLVRRRSYGSLLDLKVHLLLLHIAA